MSIIEKRALTVTAMAVGLLSCWQLSFVAVHAPHVATVPGIAHRSVAYSAHK